MTALPLTIPHAAEAAARRWPDAVALIEGAQTRTFAQLWQECRAAASALLERGVKDGDRIAIWAPNCREWVVAAVAAQACGAAIVPLNTRLKGREAGDILRRTHARMLFTVAGFLGIDYPALLAAEDLPDLAETVLLDRDFAGFVASGKGAADPRIDASLASLTPDHVSDIMFTSGTTGVPKGVLMTHGRILPQVGVWIGNTGLAQGERYLIANPFFHSFGMKVGWVACLLAGAVMVPMPQFDVAEAIRLIEQERIAFLPGPPTIFQMLLAERDQRPFDCSSLRGGTTGAATVPPVLIERIRSELGMKDIITAYGMTECVNITSCRPGDPVELIAQTCGAAIPGNEVIIAGENGEELPRGETGEILVRGTGVMLGYLDDPAATAEAIDAAGSIPAMSARWTPIAMSGSPTARRTCSFPAGSTSTRPRSRRSSPPIRQSAWLPWSARRTSGWARLAWPSSYRAAAHRSTKRKSWPGAGQTWPITRCRAASSRLPTCPAMPRARC